MTYTIDDVRSKALLILSDVPENLALLDIMCEAAKAELERILIHPMESEAEKSLFLSSAGMLAVSGYMQTGTHGDITSFKAGSVQIQRSEGKSDALALRERAYRLLAGYIADADFAFVGVRG